MSNPVTNYTLELADKLLQAADALLQEERESETQQTSDMSHKFRSLKAAADRYRKNRESKHDERGD